MRILFLTALVLTGPANAAPIRVDINSGIAQPLPIAVPSFATAAPTATEAGTTAEIGARVAQVMAKVPLANLFGYTSDLRSATKGQGSFSMEFSHYARVSAELADLPPSVTARK